MTAVEWLEEKAKEFVIDLDLLHYFEQAKEMEKQQIIDAIVNGVCEGIDIGARPMGQPITEDISNNHEIYYNETFNK
jgi:hypothetical protein